MLFGDDGALVDVGSRWQVSGGSGGVDMVVERWLESVFVVACSKIGRICRKWSKMEGGTMVMKRDGL